MAARWPEPDEWRLSGPGSLRLRLVGYAHVALPIFAAVVCTRFLNRPFPPSIGYLLHGVMVSQFLLLAVWAGMASRGERIVGVVVWGSVYLSSALALPVAIVATFDEPALVVMAFPMFCGSLFFWLPALGTAAVIVRVIGRRLGVVRRVISGETNSASQWSLWQMMIVTAIFAGVAAIAGAVRPPWAAEPVGVAVVLLFCVTLALLAVSLVWAVLGPGNVTLRIAAVALEVALLGATFGYAIGGEADHLLIGWGLFAPPAALMAASLAAVRSCGFRLVSVPRLREREKAVLPAESAGLSSPAV